MASMLELPHTQGCLVCGRSNPAGLHLRLSVDPAQSHVATTWLSRVEQIGFEGLIHGGVVSAVLDEAMVWAAIWASGRACVAAELVVRFKKPARVGQTYSVIARPDRVRPKLIESSGEILDHTGAIVATATGKFSPLSVEATAIFARTFVAEPQSRAALQLLQAKFIGNA